MAGEKRKLKMRDICHYLHDMTAYDEKKRSFMEKLWELISLVRQKYAKVNGTFAHQQKKKQGAFNMLLIIAIKKYEVPRNKETIKLCKLLSEIS